MCASAEKTLEANKLNRYGCEWKHHIGETITSVFVITRRSWNDDYCSCLYVCLSVCLFVWLFIWLSVYMSSACFVCLFLTVRLLSLSCTWLVSLSPTYLSVCLHCYLPVYLVVFLRIPVYLNMPVCLSLCVSICGCVDVYVCLSYTLLCWRIRQRPPSEICVSAKRGLTPSYVQADSDYNKRSSSVQWQSIAR